MEDDDILKTLNQLCGEAMKPNDLCFKIGMETKLSDVGMDSFSFVRLVVLIEEYFDIEFSLDDLAVSNFTTFFDILNYILSSLKK